MPTHVPGLTSDLQVALDAFRRIIQTLRQSSRDAERRVGLSAAQLFALQQLAAMSGASVSELAASTFTHQSSVSVVVQRLVERKLVAKMTSPDDRRRVRLAVTEAGRALLRRSPEPVQDRLISGIAALPLDQRQAFVHALTTLADAVAGGSAPPPMLFEDHTRGRQAPRTRTPRRARRARRA